MKYDVKVTIIKGGEKIRKLVILLIAMSFLILSAADLACACNTTDNVPVAYNDSVTTLEDTSVSGDLASNDIPSGDGGNVWSLVSNPSHGSATVNENGTYTYTPNTNYNGHDRFIYKIRDDNGNESTAKVCITVCPVNDVPVARNDSVTTNMNTTVDIHVLSNDTDVDNDTLGVISYTNPSHGTVTITDGVATYKPNTSYVGLDCFEYTISDGHEGTSNANVTITVYPVNHPPVARDDSFTTSESTYVNIIYVYIPISEILSNDTDVDNDTLSVVGRTQPANGTLFQCKRAFTYYPYNGFTGLDSFTYTISDGHGGNSTATIYITVNAVNHVPVARDDFVTTNMNTGVGIHVLNNDSDVDNDTLSVVGNTNPCHGSVTFSGGFATYTPDTGFIGTDCFEYTISDGHGGNSTATVHITVCPVNHVPVARDDTVTTNVNTPVGIHVLNNDSDVDNDTLSIISVTTPSHGDATVNNGIVTYTPNEGYYGSESFIYTICDGHGGNSTATVHVNIPSADLSVTKKADRNKASCGDIVHFTIVVQNKGPNTAVSTKVTEFMPSGLQFESYVASIGSYDSETGIWTIGDLPTDTNATLTITSIVKGSGSLVNRVKVTSIWYDPILDDNSANSLIEVSEKVKASVNTPIDAPVKDQVKDQVKASVESVNVSAKTVPMQATGIPLVWMVIAVLMVLGGFATGKKK